MTKAARVVVGLVGILGLGAGQAWGYGDCRDDSSSWKLDYLDDDGDGQCEAPFSTGAECCVCVNPPACTYGYSSASDGAYDVETSATAFGDCDDIDNDIYTGAEEVCDGKENDCDDTTTEADDATDRTTWYFDSDSDGYGDPDVSTEACTAPSTYVSSNEDCDDDDSPDIYPGATEVVGDEIDENCDGDERCYSDDDGDNARSTSEVTSSDLDCDDAGEASKSQTNDCDDTDKLTYFGASERCDGKNTDCTDSTGSYDSNRLSNVPTEETDDDRDGYVECCDYGVYEDDGTGTVSLDGGVYAWASAPAIGEYGWSDYCFPDGPPTALSDAGVVGGGDCDDTVLTGIGIHPGLGYETCECSGTGPSPAQRDTDCNGDLNTYIDSGGDVTYTSTPDEAVAAGEPATCSDNYYVDCDADGYAGDKDEYASTERGPKVLCVATEDEISLMVSQTETVESAICEDGATVLAESTATDCNDRNPDVHTGLDEVCDGLDNDCDNLVDELDDSSDQLLGSTKLYLDGDGDGQGVKDESGPYLYLCSSLGEGACAASSEAGTVVEVNFASEAIVGGGLADTVYDDYSNPDGDNLACYVSSKQDCNDHDDAIFKRDESYELLDGKDNDCTSGIPLVELDCDQDGVLTGDIPLGDPISSDQLGLQSCSEAGDLASNVQCWGGAKIDAGDLVCDAETGLWQLPVALADSTYVDSTTSTLINVLNLDDVGDCDDRCDKRYPEHSEICDGLDNDCTLVSSSGADVNRNGIPDAMEETLSGYVDVDELDMDADGYLACTDSADMSGVAVGVSSRSCSDELEEGYTAPGFGDPLDLCARVVPSEGAGEPDGVCDGIGLYAGDDADETDGEGDDHMICGVSDLTSEEAIAFESIFALVYVPEDLLEGGSGTSEQQIVPLIEPRRKPEVGDSDSASLDTADSSRSGSVRACDGWLSEALDDLVSRADVEPSSDTEGVQDRLFDVCVQAQSCYEQTLAGGVTDTECEALTGRCTVVEIVFDNLADDEILELLRADGSWPDRAEALGTDCVSSDVYLEDELIVRSVWSQERIAESRRRVVEWECFRLFGTYGCGDLSKPEQAWASPYGDANGDPIVQPGGHFLNPAVYSASDEYSSSVWSDPAWWKELGRFDVAVTSECLGGCWTDDALAPYAALDEGEGFSTSLRSAKGVSDDVGGDCDDHDTGANRDMPEGPDDLLGVYLDAPASCDTCLDGIDNNCNGMTDCEDPGCAICFVGAGVGCGSDSKTPCRDAAGCSSAAARPLSRWPATALAVGLLTIAGLLARRRRSS